MLLFIILALLVILAKSLIPLAATDAGFTFDAVVAIAGLLSFIALFAYIFWPYGTSGKSDAAVRPAERAIAGSGLVRRLVRAKADPAKQRIRAQLKEIDDERLVGLGLTSQDIAALRDTASPSRWLLRRGSARGTNTYPRAESPQSE